MLTPDQVAARAQGIGASEAVILFPEIPNPYSTPYKLWMLKTGRIEKDQELNDFQWWGHALEPAIATRYEYETGEVLESHPETVFHPNLPFMLCHPDRYVVGKRKLVEIKTAQYSPESWGEPGTDRIPPEYVMQVQHQLSCTGYDEADLIVFFLNYRKSNIYNLKRDNELISIIESKVIDFWNNNVLADVAPALTAVSDYKMKFKRNNLDLYRDATPEILEILNVYHNIRSQISRSEQQEQECLKHLLGFIGEASGIKYEGKTLATWTCDKNGKRSFRPTKR